MLPVSESRSTFAHPVGRWFWFLGLVQAAHSIGEMRMGLYDFFGMATGRIHAWIPIFPQMRMTAVAFAVLNMGLIALLFGAAPFVATGKSWARLVAWVVGVGEVFHRARPLA
jgi:hypothetical protein